MTVLSDARSLFRDPDNPWPGHIPAEAVEWKRPLDIGDTPDEPPSLFLDGADEGDVIQGALGDCWFLGAVSVLSSAGQPKHQQILENIFVSARQDGGGATAMNKRDREHCQKYGIYIMKFFKWVDNDEDTDVYVIIDDQIPCNPSGKPLYARSKSVCHLP
eukprot:SAG31_NODE_2262_length_6062_cov_12.422774_4_plen_160_part_00